MCGLVARAVGLLTWKPAPWRVHYRWPGDTHTIIIRHCYTWEEVVAKCAEIRSEGYEVITIKYEG